MASAHLLGSFGRTGRVVVACAFLAVLATAVLLPGCEKRRNDSASPLVAEDIDYVLIMVFDLSGSFTDLMAHRGKAYAFALRVMDRYFRDRLGENDRIIIGQISATDKALIYDGSPVRLRREFPSAEAFRDHLLAHADPNGSRVHAATAAALDYALVTYPGITAGKTRSALFVLSDMEDTTATAKHSEQALLRSLRQYGRANGIVGLYYVEEPRLAPWRSRLRDAQVRSFVVESRIVGEPTLPSFE